MRAAGTQTVLYVYAPQNSTFTVAPHPGRETEVVVLTENSPSAMKSSFYAHVKCLSSKIHRDHRDQDGPTDAVCA